MLVLEATHISSALTGDAPEHREVSTVGDGCRVGETVLPEVGPVPGHLDDERPPLASYLTDPPIVHGHGAQYKQPSKCGD